MRSRHETVLLLPHVIKCFLFFQCQGGGAFDLGAGWGNCIKEKTCSGLPDPPSETGLVKQTQGDSVKLGEHVVYECQRRAEFFETPNVG